MTAPVVTVGALEPVTAAMRLFASHRIHHLPVVDESGPSGMLSSADMLKLEHFVRKTDTGATSRLLNDRFRVETIMRRPVICADPDDTIADAAASMASHGIHSLPVVCETNRLVGIVTTTDIMAALLHRLDRTSAPGAREAKGKPTAEERRRAVEAAESAVLNRMDTDGVAASMLYLRERNELLEGLRRDVTRYMRTGQDEQLHARLLNDIDRLERQPDVSTLL